MRTISFQRMDRITHTPRIIGRLVLSLAAALLVLAAAASASATSTVDVGASSPLPSTALAIAGITVLSDVESGEEGDAEEGDAEDAGAGAEDMFVDKCLIEAPDTGDNTAADREDATVEEGIFGDGGRAGWLARWQSQMLALGLFYSPEEWAALIGHTQPDWVAAIQQKTGFFDSFAGSDPFDYAPQTEAGKLLYLNMAYGGSWLSVEQAIDDLELPFEFASIAQSNANYGGNFAEVESNCALQNVIPTDHTDPEKFERFVITRAESALANGPEGKAALQGYLATWRSFVPDWAAEVKASLEAQGIPFTGELLRSPGMNLTDPSKPLFFSSAPSLFSLGSLHTGELTWLRSLTARQLMEQVWPFVFRYYHRGAGQPVPDDLKAGLTFGGGVWLDCDDGLENRCVAGKKLLRSPLTELDVYETWGRFDQLDGGNDPQALIARIEASDLDANTKSRYIAIVGG